MIPRKKSLASCPLFALLASQLAFALAPESGSSQPRAGNRVGHSAVIPAPRPALIPVDYDPHSVIVQFKPGTRAPAVATSTFQNVSPGAPLAVIPIGPGETPQAAIRRLQERDDVVFAELNARFHVAEVPNDPLWPQQWDMVKIDSPDAWDAQTDAPDVVVAVVDTGISFQHPDLQDNLWTDTDGSHGYSCILRAPGGDDDFGHGTHVAGTIGARGNNGIGIAGENWRVQLASFKFLNANGFGSLADAVACFDRIIELKDSGRANIRVTSNSWGSSYNSLALQQAMARVSERGIVHVCAAGNVSADVDQTPFYPAAYPNREIIAVLATDAVDHYARFNQYDWTDFGLGSIDIGAPGLATLSTVPTGACSLCNPTGYAFLSGTSMATPHVTGVLAALFQLNPNLSASEARDVLLDYASVDPLDDAIASASSTGGRLNYAQTLTNPLALQPVLNGFPMLAVPPTQVFNPGDAIELSADGTDPDGDPLRYAWVQKVPGLGHHPDEGWVLQWVLLNRVLPFADPTYTQSLAFQAPASLARPAVATYLASVADGRGGRAQAEVSLVVRTQATLPEPTVSLSTSQTVVEVGQPFDITFSGVDYQGNRLTWWPAICEGGFFDPASPASQRLAFYQPDTACRIKAYSFDPQLYIGRTSSLIVRTVDAIGEPPVANAAFDKLVGPVPLTVHVNGSTSYSADHAPLADVAINCSNAIENPPQDGDQVDCHYSKPGIYEVQVYASTAAGRRRDLEDYYVIATPSGVNVPHPVPSAHSLSPDSTTAECSDRFDLTVNGADFIYGASVKWNGSVRPTTYVNSTQLIVSIPPSDLCVPGTAQVSVFNPGVGGGDSESLPFGL